MGRLDMNSYTLTPENLVGSLSSLILKLGKVKRDLRGVVETIPDDIRLLGFLVKAGTPDYEDLLKRGNQILISEDFLHLLHQRLVRGEVNLTNLYNGVIGLKDFGNHPEEVEKLMGELKKLIENLLWLTKINNPQTM